MQKLKEALSNVFPFLRELLGEEIIPNAIKKGYQAFDSFADEKIEALAAQVDKYENSLEAGKREKYRKGIELGAKALKAIAEKINIAADAFLEAVK